MESLTGRPRLKPWEIATNGQQVHFPQPLHVCFLCLVCAERERVASFWEQQVLEPLLQDVYPITISADHTCITSRKRSLNAQSRFTQLP